MRRWSGVVGLNRPQLVSNLGSIDVETEVFHPCQCFRAQSPEYHEPPA